MKTLSKAQAHIADILLENPDCSLRSSRYFNHQAVVNSDGVAIKFFKKTTLDCLLNTNMFFAVETGHYILKQNMSEDDKKSAEDWASQRLLGSKY